MGKKANKASRKYAASGQLKKEIQARKKHQQIKRTVERRKAGKSRDTAIHSEEKENLNQKRRGEGKGKIRENTSDGEEDEEDDIGSQDGESKQFNGMSVDDFLKGGFIDGEAEDGASESDEDVDSENDDGDDASFASVDDLENEAEAHKIELEKLAEKDPEFYKYLQENDAELLDFDVPDGDDDDDSMDELSENAMEGVEGEEDVRDLPQLTKKQLRIWQKALLEHRSLRALRRLLIAFRSAVYMNDEDQVLAWSIDSPAVYEKVVVTSLRYTPIILDHHAPYRTLTDGRIKPPVQNPKLKTLQKLILSYFHNILHLIDQLSEHDTLLLAVNESAKIVPYIINSRKAVKAYLKACLKLWSSAEDDIRIASFLAIRKLTAAGDESIRDMVLKSTYLSLVRNTKSTTAHTLPSINLMKNTASELFCADHAAAYQHAFGYVRQLAVHLRNSMKVKSKDAYKQVYNWQYVHSVDLWSMVLAKACNAQAEAQRGEESELKALIYPLTQVALGAIKLIPNARSYPFHLCLIRSLIHLSRHTTVYIPLAPYLIPIIASSLSPSSRPKSSTLKPLDLETCIRAPAQYQRTRIYYDTVLEEAIYLLAEWLAMAQTQGSIAFPELIVPLTITLKKAQKNASGGKEAGIVKGLLERVEDGARWISQHRSDVSFGPMHIEKVNAWERNIDLDETPMGKYIKSQRKVREKRRKLLEKAREGEEEYLDN